MSLNAVDIVEIFLPPRFIAKAKSFGLKPGVAIDLSVIRLDTGVAWDLLKDEDEAELERIQKSEQPWLLTGSLSQLF